MWPDRVSNPGPLTYESGALPTALHSPATFRRYVPAGTNPVHVVYCHVQPPGSLGRQNGNEVVFDSRRNGSRRNGNTIGETGVGEMGIGEMGVGEIGI